MRNQGDLTFKYKMNATLLGRGRERQCRILMAMAIWICKKQLDRSPEIYQNETAAARIAMYRLVGAWR